MKKGLEILSIFIMISIITIIIAYQHKISYFVVRNIIYKQDIKLKPKNQYSREKNYKFVQITNNFTAKNKQDIKNIFYTAIDAGWDEFTFFCDQEYHECSNDLEKISTKDDDTLAHINSFVAPYNTFSKVDISINSFGKIIIKINKIYKKEQIEAINAVLDTTYKSIINEKMSTKDKLKIIHDFIINNTKYDTKRAEILEKKLDDSNNLYESHIAYGALIQGVAICGGYTDAFSLFLDKMGINNYRIISGNHTWNYLEVDNNWYHTDLTWDDPVIKGQETEVLMHNFFLITDAELTKLNPINHEFPKDIYLK